MSDKPSIKQQKSKLPIKDLISKMKKVTTIKAALELLKSATDEFKKTSKSLNKGR